MKVARLKNKMMARSVKGVQASQPQPHISNQPKIPLLKSHEELGIQSQKVKLITLFKNKEGAFEYE